MRVRLRAVHVRSIGASAWARQRGLMGTRKSRRALHRRLLLRLPARFPGAIAIYAVIACLRKASLFQMQTP